VPAASFFFIHFLSIVYLDFIVISNFEEGQISSKEKSAQLRAMRKNRSFCLNF